MSGLSRNILGMDNGVKNLNTDGRLYIIYTLQIRPTRVGAGYVNTDFLKFTNPISNTANEKTKNNLTLKVFKTTPEPYATRATVPDSNYTSTGYANARYRGTKTSASTFSGVSPAFGAKLFKGLAFEKPGEFDFAGGFTASAGLYEVIADKAISASANRFEDFFFNTEGLKPEQITEAVGHIATSSLNPVPNWLTTSNLSSTTDNQFVLRLAGEAELQIGDIIAFNSSAGTNAAQNLNPERCIVINIEPVAFKNYIVPKPLLTDVNNRIPDPDLKRITVLRGQFNSGNNRPAASSHGRKVRVFKLGGSTIFKIEGSRAVGVPNKLIVLDAENIAANLDSNASSSFDFVQTDERGNIINMFTTSAKSGSL